jgi:phosphate-selective porin
MKRKTTILLCGLLLMMPAAAQEKPTAEQLEKRVRTLEEETAKQKKFKVSGYIQAQYQWGEEKASLKVGSPNDDPSTPFNRIGIRRGRVKFTYEEGIASGVFQLDITEKGVGFKDAYLNIKDPWVKSIALRVGIFDRPFGNEISYSSSKRESPERSTVFQTLFPDERDLGAMLVLQAPNTSAWSVLKLEAGLFAGNGIKQETDNRKDFIGHLWGGKTFENTISFGLGASYYNGGIYQPTEDVYTMQGDGFVLSADPSNKGRYAKREYIGFDAQFSIKSIIGITQLRGEYLFGQQPGTRSSSKSPNYADRPRDLPENDIYIRKFTGAYVILVQDIGTWPFSAVVKFDFYDPDTKISRDEVGVNSSGKADLWQNTLGIGALWHINQSLRMQAFFEFNNNEKTMNVAGMNENVNDNIFTLRLQYKF